MSNDTTRKSDETTAPAGETEAQARGRTMETEKTLGESPVNPDAQPGARKMSTAKTGDGADK